MNPVAAVVVAGTALVIGLGLRPLRGAVRRRAGLMAEANLSFATGLTEFAATTQEARIFVVEDQVRSRLDELVDDVGRRQRGRIILVQLLPAVYQAAALSLIVGALAVAYSMGFSELSTLGAVVLIMLRSVSYGQGAQSGFQSRHDSAPYFELLEAEVARYRAAAVDRTGDAVEPHRAAHVPRRRVRVPARSAGAVECVVQRRERRDHRHRRAVGRGQVDARLTHPAPARTDRRRGASSAGVTRATCRSTTGTGT